MPCFCEPLTGAVLAILAGNGRSSVCWSNWPSRSDAVHMLDAPTGAENPGTLLLGATYQATLQGASAVPNLSMPFVLLSFNKVSVGTPSGGFAMWNRRDCLVSDDFAQSSTP